MVNKWTLKGMKSIILMVFAIISSMMAGDNVASCKIDDGRTTSTVYASVIAVDKNVVTVHLSNDGVIAVNVQVNVSCKKGGNIVKGSTSKLVRANDECDVVIYTNLEGLESPTDWTVTVSGRACK